MAFGIKQYFQPTPKRLRIIGDSLASASTAVSAYAIFNDMKVLAAIVIISGWAGKFITNFFTDTDVADKPKENQQL